MLSRVHPPDESGSVRRRVTRYTPARSMVSHRFRAAFVTLLLLLSVRALSAAESVPPLSWTCPMHPEVVTDKAGKCPICGMKLAPVRLDLLWTCPVHGGVSARNAGRCPRCRRELVRVIKSASWTCRVHPKVNELNPGARPICRRPLTIKYADRPHGDHNPKHGGLFFMAPNNWRLEGTHPAEGIFRLYAYDEYSKPFTPPAVSGRLIVPPPRGSNASERTIPSATIPGKAYLEPHAPDIGVPADVVLKMKFQATDQEYRFDFQFVDYSKEPTAPGR